VDALAVILAVVLLGVVVFVVSAPLRGVLHPSDPESGAADCAGLADRAADLAGLRAAREAKYREIRDAEMDYRTGKLAQEDYAAVDATLRAEAVEILDRLTALGEETTD
jgi:hypothetical protein